MRLGSMLANSLTRKRRALESYRAGGIFSQEEIEGFMTEGQAENGWFEVMGWLRGIH